MVDFDVLFEEYVPSLIGADNVIHASVVVPIIYIDGVCNFIFEVRSKKLRHQPGEISFPGGKIESGERAKDAAIREFCEELMCSEDKLRIVSEIDTYLSPTRALIHCFLAEVDNSIDLNVKNDEVDSIFCVPLKYFLETVPEEYTNKVTVMPDDDFPYNRMSIPQAYKWGTPSYPVYFYEYENKLIWGITANIARNFVKKLNSML
ncbi:CoA pyrophosphatase [Peptostreptococcus russellii]|uniref:NUDIX hydrolase n=1 Tax=Peptostreptococcus russellii TaxID=215200 RepID=UPI0016281E1D|nr:CoA pyrophosphatase [Peptostreptococcus russellii]MBC2577387.1 CoA pyrophosphatase [Peptostreptococcus russellii]